MPDIKHNPKNKFRRLAITITRVKFENFELVSFKLSLILHSANSFSFDTFRVNRNGNAVSADVFSILKFVTT